jgi:hypothetical protein
VVASDLNCSYAWRDGDLHFSSEDFARPLAKHSSTIINSSSRSGGMATPTTQNRTVVRPVRRLGGANTSSASTAVSSMAAAVDAAVRVALSPEISIEEGSPAPERRNLVAAGCPPSFMAFLPEVERQLQMQPDEAAIFDHGFIKFYKIYREYAAQLDQLGTKEKPAPGCNHPVNAESTSALAVTTTSLTHESLVMERAALVSELERLSTRSEMVTGSIAGIDALLQLRSSTGNELEDRLRKVLRELLLTMCPSFMSEYVRIRRQLRAK